MKDIYYELYSFFYKLIFILAVKRVESAESIVLIRVGTELPYTAIEVFGKLIRLSFDKNKKEFVAIFSIFKIPIKLPEKFISFGMSSKEVLEWKKTGKLL